MAKYHRTPFAALLKNILDVTEDYQAGFTFPIVASAALKHPELISSIMSSHQEVASHGFNHINYKYLSLEAQRRDIMSSLLAFENLGVPVRGFRAPYNMYAAQTPQLLEESGFLWDGGLGYSQQYRRERSFFRVQVYGRESRFVSMPLSKWSDDIMIDRYGLDSRHMAKLLKRTLRQTKEKKGVIMFDLHPIRIGQPKYINLLERILSDGMKWDGWFPTITEAVEHWLRHEELKHGASFCCLLSGDIDNSDFHEYLARLL